MTAFHIAAFNGFTDIMEVMIEYAESQGEKESKRLINFINRKCSLSAMSYAIINDQFLAAYLLVKKKAMIYYSHTYLQKDLSPLFLAVFKQNLNLIELMTRYNT